MKQLKLLFIILISSISTSLTYAEEPKVDVNVHNCDLVLKGDASLQDVAKNYVGESIDNVDPNSVVGKYLAETGAKSKVIQYAIAPGSEVLGPKKLLVAVSQQSWEAFQKVLNTNEYMTVVGHANVIHKNRFYSIHGGATQDVRMPGVNTPLPFLIFKPTEAERLKNYLQKTSEENGWYTGLKQPWKIPGYCATGGYACCTHWIGNIPIGDRMVNEYKFPLYNQAADKAVKQELKEYEGNEQYKTIWKVPGHEQLSSAIGLEENNLNGEFASPGWVIRTLMGSASTERVPVIFVITADHLAELPDPSVFNYENPW